MNLMNLTCRGFVTPLVTSRPVTALAESIIIFFFFLTFIFIILLDLFFARKCPFCFSFPQNVIKCVNAAVILCLKSGLTKRKTGFIDYLMGATGFVSALALRNRLVPAKLQKFLLQADCMSVRFPVNHACRSELPEEQREIFRRLFERPR